MALFVMVPAFVARLPIHPVLSGHFILLGALYLVFRPEKGNRSFAWITLLLVTSLIDLYTFVTVGVLWVGDALDKIKAKRINQVQFFAEAMVAIVVVCFAVWQAGYFEFNFSDTVFNRKGYGDYPLNLLSFIDPSGWSYVLPDIPQKENVRETFYFLGLGMIILGYFAYRLEMNNTARLSLSSIYKIVLHKRKYLSIAMILLFLFSTAGTISIAVLQLKIPLPQDVVSVFSIFRSSARFFLPVYYIAFIFIIFILLRNYDSSLTKIILLLALTIQVLDTSHGWYVPGKSGYEKIAHPSTEEFYDLFSREPSSEWKTKLASPFWNEVGQKYKKIRLYPPRNQGDNWKDIAYFAGKNGLSSGAFALAKVNEPLRVALTKKAMERISAGIWDADTLYILEDRLLEKQKIEFSPESDLFARVDGLNVLAPNWKKCKKCLQVSEDATIDTINKH
jgi:hypothetical protein